MAQYGSYDLSLAKMSLGRQLVHELCRTLARVWGVGTEGGHACTPAPVSGWCGGGMGRVPVAAHQRFHEFHEGLPHARLDDVEAGFSWRRGRVGQIPPVHGPVRRAPWTCRAPAGRRREGKRRGEEECHGPSGPEMLARGQPKLSRRALFISFSDLSLEKAPSSKESNRLMMN